MKLYNTLSVIALFIALPAFSQQYKQTIRGQVLDRNLQTPISGVTVCVDGDTSLCDTSDIYGNYEIKNVKVGRHNLSGSLMGYGEAVIPSILLNSGKELVVNILMEENIKLMKGFSKKGNAVKSKPLNDMATVSARSFSVEETQKFAAAINDPARMATSFAGVVGADDGNNTIVIRGNSPAGMLWRMEGIDIPGPNHFANFTGSGGGISILSAQLLSNSDFYTGAFPAEYGNALSGVFDLKLRKGNTKKREYTFQAGFLGIDLATEGPLTKKGGSYLVNYRYSTLGVLQKMGIDITGSTTLFQDLSFNVVFPQSKIGTFSAFGFGGLSNQYRNAPKDSSKWETIYDRYSMTYGSNTGAVGLTHTINSGRNTTFRSVLLYSANSISDIGEYYKDNYNVLYTHWKNTVYNGKVSLHSMMNHKISPNVHLRAGVILNHWNYKAVQKELDSLYIMRTYMNTRGETDYGQAYAQFKIKVDRKLSLFAGAHTTYMLLNKSYSAEPRLSLRYDVNSKRAFSLGYGLHSQLQLPGIYFSEVIDSNGNKTYPNKKLGLSKSHHLVASIEQTLNSGIRFKLETYYQHLYNIPSGIEGSTASVLNMSFGTISQKLEGTGLGKNYGVELTMEKSLAKGFYYLISTSLYQSKYTTGNGKWYDTRFNGRHSVMVTAGKEIKMRGDKRILGLNFKTVWYGGFRQTPIDVEKSRLYNLPINDESKVNSIQLPNYFRTDIKISYRINHKKYNSIWSLDIQNASNHKNVGGTYYDVDKEEVKTWYQTPLLPVFSYKIEF